MVCEVLDRIPEELSSQVEEVTLDMSGSMRKIIHRCFPSANCVIDRSHVQQPAFDAIQEMRIAHRWDAINQETDEKENAKLLDIKYRPEILPNGDTLKQLLAEAVICFSSLWISGVNLKREEQQFSLKNTRT